MIAPRIRFMSSKLPLVLSLVAVLAACSPSRGGDERSERQKARHDKQANHAGARIKKMDKNGDGTVTSDEVPAGKERQFKKLDANGDGQLTGDELRRKSKR